MWTRGEQHINIWFKPFLCGFGFLFELFSCWKINILSHSSLNDCRRFYSGNFDILNSSLCNIPTSWHGTTRFHDDEQCTAWWSKSLTFYRQSIEPPSNFISEFVCSASLYELPLWLGIKLPYFYGTDRIASILKYQKNCLFIRYQITIPTERAGEWWR